METIKFYRANKQTEFTSDGDVIGITEGHYDTDIVYNLTTGMSYTLKDEYQEAKQIKHSTYPLYEREMKNLEKFNLTLDWNLLG